MTAARLLARWGVELQLGDVPVEVRRRVGHHVADTLGCGLGAHRLGAAAPALAVARALGGGPEATLIGGPRVGAPAAALGNGSLMHALDFDDTHADSLIHVTVAVLPAALAVAEERSATGEDLLLALLAGMEAVVRLGAAVRHGFHSKGFHATSVCGTFASALAAARLYGLDDEGAVNAIGIAGSFAAGSLEFLATGSSTKQLHPGWAAHAGVLAARLAAAGATGPDSILEGSAGLYRAYLGQSIDPRVLTAGLGNRWESAQVTIKPYPVCQLSHASLDALDAAGVGAADVDSVLFKVPAESAAIVCSPEASKWHPRTPYEAKFSLQWCAAALLVDGSLDVQSFEAARLERPEVLALASRVAYQAYDPGMAAAGAGGRAEIRLKDGSMRVSEVRTSRGSPDSLLSEDQLLQKFRLNAGPGWEEVARMALRLESLASVKRLGESLRQAAGVMT